MSRRVYRFDVLYEDGHTEEDRHRRCFAANAPVQAARLLDRTPGAAAVYAVECAGRSVHAVYAPVSHSASETAR